MMSSRDDVHGALNIEPDGGFAAEERGGAFERPRFRLGEIASEKNNQMGLLGNIDD